MLKFAVPSPVPFPGRTGLRLGLLSLLAALSVCFAQPVLAKKKSRAEDLTLRSQIVLVVDQESGEALVEKNADVTVPIASLTKLMTALVVLDAKLPLDEMIEIGKDDVDREKHTHSRLTVGTRLSRRDLLLLALMSSENRAANALGGAYPGGRTAFITQMNLKAKQLGMKSSQFADPAGLSMESMSTARDLLRLVSAADTHELIREFTTRPQATVRVRKQTLTFVNTNRMVRNSREWDIGLQKTGFTNEAGRCLVMRATTLDRKLSMVFLNSDGALTRFADAARVRRQIELGAKSEAVTPVKKTPTAKPAAPAKASSKPKGAAS